MKKILLINNGYPSKKNKHYTSYIKSIKECLENAGFNIDLIVMSSEFDNILQKTIAYIRYYNELFFFKKYNEFDFVYINNYPHSFLPLILHFHKMKKIIIHWHGDDIQSNSFFKKIFNEISYFFIPKRTLHISPSKYFSTKISEKIKISKKSIYISPSGGVDIELFKPINKKNKNKNKIILGFSSHLSEAKGIDLVIKFLENLNTLHEINDLMIEFHYIKYGIKKDYYSNILNKFNNTIEHGMYKKEDMPIFYNQIDLFLFPTTGDSLGSVGLEALSCGIPILGTDDFAIKEYVRPGVNGEVFTLGDYSSFEKNLIKCIKAIDNYNPRQTILEEYSKAAVTKEYIQFLK